MQYRSGKTLNLPDLTISHKGGKCQCYKEDIIFDVGDKAILLVPKGRSSKIKNLRRPFKITGKYKQYSGGSLVYQAQFLDDNSFAWITGDLSYWHKLA